MMILSSSILPTNDCSHRVCHTSGFMAWTSTNIYDESMGEKTLFYYILLPLLTCSLDYNQDKINHYLFTFQRSKMGNFGHWVLKKSIILGKKI